MDFLTWYIERVFGVTTALIVTGFAILIAVVICGMIHALYKGATDRTGR